MSRIIKVDSCIYCPITRLMRIKDGPFCSHPAVDGMEVGEYTDRVHPDCPLPLYKETEDTQ